jgi:leucyl-tRNA synthetase
MAVQFVMRECCISVFSYRAEQMTPDVWNYIFYKDSKFPVSTDIPKASLDLMKREFEYWYPVDLRCSGKDLIQNHLTFFIYNHCALWPDDESKWPLGIRANGHMLLNSSKVCRWHGVYDVNVDSLLVYHFL